MAWNKGLPLGSKAGNLLDDDVRTNNDALESALTEEHVFSTGGDQTGKHKFAVEAKGTRDADSDYVAGSVSIVTDEVSGQYVFTYFDGTDWHTTIAAFLNNPNDWAKGQYVTPTALAGAGSIANNLADANIFTIALTGNAIIANPGDIGDYSGKSGVWFYIVTQDDPARSLSFDTLFAGDNLDNIVSTVVNSVNVFQCVLDSAGKLQTSLLNPPFATDAETQAATIDYRNLTPKNLAANHDDTASAGYFEVLGTGLLFQWIKIASAINGTDYDFATAFADTNYTVVGTSNGSSYADWAEVVIVDADTVTVYVENNGYPFSVIAIGKKP